MIATGDCAATPCTCGCCDGVGVLTPMSEYNPPGLDALAYRAGTFATFKETMLARLSGLHIDLPLEKGEGVDRLYPLNGLTARDSGDPSIALLDAWAVIADVLTFYQERIANEGYLATALERRSILELARLVGYRMRPGVASSVYLAFFAALGFEGDIPTGARAQSVPGPGEHPQVFETSDKLTARAVWNAMKPRLTRPQLLSPPRPTPASPVAVTDVSVIDTVYLDGVATNLKTGNALLFVFDADSGAQCLRLIESVTAQAEHKRTEIVLTQTFEGLDADAKLQLYIDKAAYLFQGSVFAEEVAAILSTLRGNLDPDLVRLAIARLQEKLSIARRRDFTRIAAWVAHIIQLLPTIAGQSNGDNTGSGDGGGDTPIYDRDFAKSSLAASPLGNLVAMASSLARQPALQPANGLRLSRTVERSFSPQSDIAAQLLADFKPDAARALYPAWRSVSKPYGWVEVYAARVNAGLFASRFAGAAKAPQVGAAPTYTEPTLATTWTALITGANAPTAVALDGVYEEIKPGSWIAIDRPKLSAATTSSGRYLSYHKVRAVRTASLDTKTGYTAKATLLTLDHDWLRSVAFGEEFSWLLNSPAVLRDTVVYAQTEALPLAEEPLDIEVAGDSLSLDGAYDGLESGRWVIVSGNRTDVENASDVKASELAMIAGVSQGSEAPLCTSFPPGFTPFSQIYYTTPANAMGDRLVVGAITPGFFDKLGKLVKPSVLNQQYCGQIELAPGFHVNAYVPSLRERIGDFQDFLGLLVNPLTGQPLTRGQIGGAPGGSKDDTPAFFGWRISTPKLHTILKFATDLAYTYDSASVSVLGNIAKATHGQSVGEVLGDGAGAQSFQAFGLRQGPLTHLSAPTASGALSTLDVRVNDIAWHEWDNLASAGPRDRVFTTRTTDDDKTTIVFGNGARGARVPTGLTNVKAAYRYGVGAAGNVAAEQISQLASQPLGVQGVINPLRASGGADGDTADEARRNTPIAVMALDRLVSVKDYADFARAFAGIGKASAVRLSDGGRQVVHVTVAGARDIPIDPNADLHRNLLAALQNYGDPSLPVWLDTRKRKVLVMSAAVQLLPDYAWEAVEPKIRAALLARYGFETRPLGQSAFLSEAVHVVQTIEGVSYVDFGVFDSVAEDATAATLASLGGTLASHPYVRADFARPNPDPSAAARFLPAELAVLTPAIPDTLILTQVGG